MEEKEHRRVMYRRRVPTRTVENFSGSRMEACKFMTTPFPSKSKTATPKKSGRAENSM